MSNNFCQDCHKPLLSHGKARRCVQCYHKFERGINNPSYKHGKNTRYNRFCKLCHKKVSYNAINDLCISCARKEYLKAHPEANRGRNHPCWKGGKQSLDKILRGLAQYEQWRQKVLSRDNFLCQVCQRKDNLETHHKIPILAICDLYQLKTTLQLIQNKLLWDINWGITLCRSCHGTVGERWINKPLEEK